LAALQTVPKELYESAIVDGAGSWEMFKRITLPIIAPVIVTITIIRSIDAFKLYALVFGITSAGPGGATESLSYYIYQIGITWFNLGQASAVSWLFLIVMITLALILISRFRRDSFK
jgi:multiple sugar transport system permease protein